MNANTILLTSENLVRFELDYFRAPSVYPHERYGQALVNRYHVEEKFAPEFDKLFYEEDCSYAREIAWMIVSGTFELAH